MVSSLAPGGATGLGAKIAVVPGGSPSTDSATGSENPPNWAMETVKLASSGAQMAADHGSGTSRKSSLSGRGSMNTSGSL